MRRSLLRFVTSSKRTEAAAPNNHPNHIQEAHARRKSLRGLYGQASRLAIGCLAVISLGLAAFVKSCKSSDEELALISLTAQEPVRIADKIASTVQTVPYFQLQVKGADGAMDFAALHSSYCRGADAKEIDFLTHLEIPGMPKQSLSLTADLASRVIRLRAGERKAALRGMDAEMLRQLSVAACQGAMQDGRRVEAAQLHAYLSGALQEFYPDCRIAATGGGFRCALNPLPASAPDMMVLQRLQHELFVSMKRQSYSLSRKVTLTKQMIEAREGGGRASALGAFCSILQSAVPSELPLVLGSDSVQAALCGPSAEIESPAALEFAISHSLGELSALVTLFEKHSRLGTLIVKVPLQPNASNELHVSIEPTEETLSSIWTPLVTAATSPARRCLSPIFLKPSAAALLHAAFVPMPPQTRPVPAADQPSASPAALTVECENDILPAEEAGRQGEILDFLASNLTSERSFSLANGNGIILRMTEGSYRYTISPKAMGLLHGRESDSAAGRQLTGLFEWRGQRPAHTIKSS